MSLQNLKMDRICRICLMEENHMKSLFSISGHYIDMDLVEMISTFSYLEVIENDKLPSQICSTCYDKAVKAYDFRSLCQRSANILRGLLNNEQEDIKPLISVTLKSYHSDDVSNNESAINVKDEAGCTKSGNVLKSFLNHETEQEDIKPLVSLTFKPHHSDNVCNNYLDVNIKDEPDCTSSNDLREKAIDTSVQCDNSKSDSTLKQHSSGFLENDKLTCTFCGKYFKTVATLKKHVKTLHQPHSCRICDEINLNKAKLLHENATQEMINQCEICHKRIELPCAFRRHLLSHTVAFTCDICNKRLKSQGSLRYHKQTLHDIRTFHICEYCQKPMTTKQALTNHIRARHTTDRPFVCKECGKAFTTATGLQRHSWNHSKGENLRHVCSFCSKPFATLNEMKVHLRVHTDEKPFMCDICGNSFKVSSHLAFHRRGHLGENKNKECSYCGKRFNSSSVLNRHIRIHTGEKPFLCQICGANFNQKNILVTHMKVHKRCENDKKVAASEMTTGE